MQNSVNPFVMGVYHLYLLTLVLVGVGEGGGGVDSTHRIIFIAKTRHFQGCLEYGIGDTKSVDTTVNLDILLYFTMQKKIQNIYEI